MSDQHRLKELSADNVQSLKTLQRALANSKGQFSLILVRCNYACLRLQILQILQEKYNLVIQKLPLEPSAKTVYTTILERFGQQKLDALVVWGFEAVEDIDGLLYATNNVRDSFHHFTFPLVLLVRDTELRQLKRKAPDFINWASPTVEFKLTERELTELLHENAQQAFAEQPEFTLDNAELKAAQQNLLEYGQELEPEVQAKLAFLAGLNCYKNFHLDDAIIQYEQSLNFWQQNQKYEHSGIVLFHIVLAYYLKGKEYQQEIKNYSQKYLEIFEEITSSNWLMKHLNKLEDVLRQLEEWEQLQLLAQKAIVLHQEQIKLNLVAQDYSFLAAVALKKISDWKEAKRLALESLKIFEDSAIFPEISNDEAQILGLTYLTLAQSQQQLGEIEDAIANLEKARKISQPEYDPNLYVEILEELRKIKFERGEHLEAFRFKQQQREVENQYGLRAFIGAGRLQPPRSVVNSILDGQGDSRDLSLNAILAASGRQKDVEALIERIKSTHRKLTVLYGPSGVGKSSIVQAALIPALEKTYFEGRVILPLLIQDYKNWVERLRERLAKTLIDYAQPANISSTLIERLSENTQRNLLTVLIFDQFEEFFFENTNLNSKTEFYDFLCQCLEIPYLKIILSLREDYIHYLLEISRTRNLKIDKIFEDILYYLGKFSTEDAKAVIHSLTTRSTFPLELNLIEQLVKDLAGKWSIVRPIELQVVGAQLEFEKITNVEESDRSLCDGICRPQ
ncbi:nSTAND1 domain-containing NTPase [Scytonema sp. NUACC21]